MRPNTYFLFKTRLILVFTSILLMLFSILGCNDSNVTETPDSSPTNDNYTISGAVYDAGNMNPLSDARIYIYGYSPDGATLDFSLLGSTGPLSTTTKSDGSYTTNLKAGNYIVAAEANGYITQFFNGVYNDKKATKVSLNSDRIASNIDFILKVGGSITGHIYESAGSIPTLETWIWYKQTSGIPTPRLGGCEPNPPFPFIEMASNGRFSISGLQEGTYLLLALPSNKQPNFYEGEPLSPMATEVPVKLGETNAIDLQIDLTGVEK